MLYLFDVLEVDGEPLVDLPLTERHERLEALLDKRNRTVRLSDLFDDGAALFEAATAQQLEGIVSKRSDSRYEPGRRSRHWLKVKTQGRQELVVAGYTKGQGRRSGVFGSLVLGVHEPGGLRWAGNVGTGFDDAEIDRVLAKLKPLRRDESPFAEVPKMPRVRKGDVVWVEPRLVAEIRFAEWTHDGRLRAPVYQGLREDKEASEVHREVAPLPDGAPQRQARPEALEPGQAVLAGGGDREGRPDRVLPRRRARARAPPARPALHDEALPRRLERQVLLPEGRSETHAGLDPDPAVRGLDPRQAAPAAPDRLRARQ